MDKIFQWGIVGPGMIANTYVQSIKAVKGAAVRAVGGRNMDKVNAFADKHNIPMRYHSFTEVMQDKEVDAVYISLPNNLHAEYVKKAIDAGKAVLCEKPMAINAKEAKELTEYARQKNVFLMEAVWTRFLPIHDQVKKWIGDGKIGEISMMRGDFAFNVPWAKGDRHINPQLGGGAVMDVGVYLISYANDILGKRPKSVVSKGYVDETGVDVKNSFIMEYENGVLVTCVSSVTTDIPNDWYIYGSKGYIHIRNFWRADSAALCIRGEEPEVVEIPFEENGYEGEAKEVMRCVQNHLTESSRMPLDETVAISEVITEMRKEWNVRFPQDEF